MKSQIYLLYLIYLFVPTILSSAIKDDSRQLPSHASTENKHERHSKSQHQDEQLRKSKNKKNGQQVNIGSRYLKKRPTRRRLDKSSLLEILGEDYEPNLMTADRPKRTVISIPSHEVNVDKLNNRWSQEELMKQMSKLNLTEELSSVDPSLVPLEDKIRQWMMRRSSCPIHFSWKDLGKKYWPRWVREGVCLKRDGYCSFPAGMNCVPGATTSVQLLNWQCELKEFEPLPRHKRSPIKDSDRETSVLYKRPPVPPLPTERRRLKRNCSWVKVPFPITIDCFCTC
ncbi:noggin-2 isoform X2 [Parasteatoda tepidariorum]